MSAFDNLGDTISNLTMYDIKSAVRKVQNGAFPKVHVAAKHIARLLEGLQI